ncbi:MAG: succinate dehydrogenase / fumarate reductase membrane anchor subunit [Pseudohongiellaceae bacterium]|jgi:succinate dehydrogenase / fumarate reductase membrane anchor subunit
MGLMNNGIRQWLFQRLSNALIISFGIGLLYMLVATDGLSYSSLSGLLSGGLVSSYLAVVLVFSCINGVLAGWQIDGDYTAKFGLPKNMITIIAIVVSCVFLVYGLLLLF